MSATPAHAPGPALSVPPALRKAKPLSPAAEATLAAYTPRSSHITEETWERIRPVVLAGVRVLEAKNAPTARTEASNLVRYFRWAISESVDLSSSEIYFGPNHVERFATVVQDAAKSKAKRKSKAQQSVASRVRKVARAATKHAEWGPERAAYGSKSETRTHLSVMSDARRADIVFRLRNQPTATLQKYGLACLTLGLGAGLAPGEWPAVRGVDITVVDGMVVVDVRAGESPRLVPVREEFVDDALDLRRLAGDETVMGQTAGWDDRSVVTNRLARFKNDDGKILVKASELCNRWMLDCLRSGVPAHLLIEAAGLTETSCLRDLFEHLSPVEPPEMARMLVYGAIVGPVPFLDENGSA